MPPTEAMRRDARFPGLMRDFALRNARLVPASDLKVEEASCTSHWWIVSNCSIRYTAPQAQAKQFSISFSVFGTLGGERFPAWHVVRAHGLRRLNLAARDAGRTTGSTVTTNYGT